MSTTMPEVQLLGPLERLRQLMEQSDVQRISALFEVLPAHEIVHLMSHLDRDEQLEILTILTPIEAAQVMEEIPEVQASQIVEDLPVANAAAILNEMPSDEQADILSELEKEDAEEIITLMRPEEAADVRKLIDYQSDTAGGLMITEYLAYPATRNVGQVILDLRRKRSILGKLHTHSIYVVNDEGHILGIVTGTDLVLNVSSTQLGEIISSDIDMVHYHTELVELQEIFNTYDYYSVPVIDEDNKLIGVVLRKDVWEAVAENTSFEHLETQGIIGGDELRTMPLWLRARRRLSWLSVNILLNILAASIIAMHQDTLSAVIALAVFLPIISDMSGCSGNQAIAVSMREISLGVVKPGESLRVWTQEISVGLINGFALGLLIAVTAYLWQGNVMLGVVVGGALMLNTMIAVSIGGTVPLLLKKRGLDPALASGPLLTTVTDMAGFFLTLSFASLAIQHLAS